MGGSSGLSRAGRPHSAARGLGAVVALTGASAIGLQVVWQRVISMHSGVDLASSTTVVAGFLLGLGVGSLLGGRIADRVDPARALGVFAACNVGVAVFAWFSVSLFYDLYRHVAPSVASRPAAFVFNVALLLVPTILEGCSLPLVARAVAGPDGSADRVGRLYGINTIGAAAGAMLAGWVLMPELGFVAAARAAASANLVAAAALWWKRRSFATASVGETVGLSIPRPRPGGSVPDRATSRRLAGWYVVSATFGAIALAFEQVHFRLVDAIGRSNSYSFALVLAMYLGCWGLGAALGSVALKRAVDRVAWYLWLQCCSGLVAALALVVVVRVLPHSPLGATMDRWFDGDGFAAGYPTDAWADIAWFALGLPALLMGVPILLLGAAYPFVQSLVADDLRSVGRRTGGLLASNIVGGVAGTVVGGFVLIDHLGTAGAFTFLCALLTVPGAVAVARGVRADRLGGEIRRSGARRAIGIISVGGLMASIVAFPSNGELWSFLVGATGGASSVAEDRSCASVYDSEQPRADDLDGVRVDLRINGATQNGSPYGDFHVLIGLLPVLLHPHPSRGLAVGFGIGSTTYAQLSDPRVRRSTTVELCAGNYELARRFANRIPALGRIVNDPRARLLTGDGRRHLLVESERYDVITVDTLRPSSANAGSHFSLEMLQLAASRLDGDGIFAEWAPTARVLDASASAFPYVVAGRVGDGDESVFFLGSRSPIEFDRDEVLRRFDAFAELRFPPDQVGSLRRFLEEWEPTCINDGRLRATPPAPVNHDLAPLDEYPLNHLASPVTNATSAC